ncbi:MAG: hypothetical protein D8M59_15100 [Planctomycetes bacterium]|nr:hypothetical protein [Planctomycetota bacterium]
MDWADTLISAMWSILRSAPMWLVAIVGLIMAVRHQRQYPRAAGYVLIACIVLLVLHVLWFPLAWSALSAFANWKNLEYGAWNVLWTILIVFDNCLLGGVWLVLLFAVFMNRHPAQAGDEYAGPTMTPAQRPGTWAEDPLAALPQIRPLSGGSWAITYALLSVGSGILMGTGLVVMAMNEFEDEGLAIGLAVCGLGFFVMIGTMVLVFRFIYRIWAAIRGECARTTPARAVGFSLIPLFNFYWTFHVFVGWTTDCRRFMDHYGVPGPRIAPGLAIWMCILGLISILPIPIVQPLIGLAVLILVIMYMVQAGHAVTAIANEQQMRLILSERSGQTARGETAPATDSGRADDQPWSGADHNG